MMLMVESVRSEEPGAEIEPVGQRQQPYEEDGSAAQSELLENMCPQRRRGECASKSARNGGGCEGSHDDPDRGLMAGPDRPLRFARELVCRCRRRRASSIFQNAQTKNAPRQAEISMSKNA